MRLDATKAPSERKRLGAYYTPELLCDIVAAHTVGIPLWQMWAKAKSEGEDAMRAYAAWLGGVRVLDPACGDGAMLVAADRQIDAVDIAVHRRLGSPRRRPMAGLLGLDIDADAVAAACQRGVGAVCTDALAGPWPSCDFILGNPPFVGGSVMRQRMGDAAALRAWAHSPHIPRACDLAMHFWTRAAERALAGTVLHMGFVMPNGYTFGRNSALADAFLQRGLNIDFAAKNIQWPGGGADATVCITVCSRAGVGGILAAA